MWNDENGKCELMKKKMQNNENGKCKTMKAENVN